MIRRLAAILLLAAVILVLRRRRPEVAAIPRWAWADDWDDPAMDVYDQ